MEQTLSPRFKNLALWQYQALQLKFENPSIPQTEIAKALEKPDSRISEFFSSDRYKNAVLAYAQDEFAELIPLAQKGLKDSLISDNARVKLDSCCKVLAETGIMSKETITKLFNQINTQINIASFDLEKKSAQELGAMLLEQIKGFKR